MGGCHRSCVCINSIIHVRITNEKWPRAWITILFGIGIGIGIGIDIDTAICVVQFNSAQHE